MITPGALLRSTARLVMSFDPSGFKPIWIRDGQIMLCVGNVSNSYVYLVDAAILYAPWYYDPFLKSIGP